MRSDREGRGGWRDVAHDRRNLQHLPGMGQPVMRKPEGREPGVTSRAHLRDHLRDAFREAEALRELRVDEQTDFHVRAPSSSYRSKRQLVPQMRLHLGRKEVQVPPPETVRTPANLPKPHYHPQHAPPSHPLN